MKKRIPALLLAIVCLLLTVSACHDRKIDGDLIKGAEINVYLNDLVYELDPAYCLNNDSAYQMCGLLYDTLFYLDENGKVKKSIVDKYEIEKNEKNDEYSMLITLKSDNKWSNGVNIICADDVVFAWKRILDPSMNSDAACLLYDILNAREAKRGDCSIDDVGIYAVDTLVLKIVFVGDIDYDAFILNLTSVALAPLCDDVVSRNGDWSKKPATTVCSGAFMLRRVNYGFDTGNEKDKSYATMILERNPYFRRPKDAKYLDTSVKPYRLIINYADSKEQQLANFLDGSGLEKVFYIGDIPISVRQTYKDTADVRDLMSTNTIYLNENADIDKSDGTKVKLFADKNVRLALSAAIDRQAIADAVVFARPADALVPYGVFETSSPKQLFRNVGGSVVSTSANLDKAREYLNAAGINPSEYSFTLSVRVEDDVHNLICEKVVEAWNALGFKVTLDPVQLAVNDEKLAGEDVKDIYDDIFAENFYINKYQAADIDLIANTPNAFSVLAPFASQFSGQSQDVTDVNAAISPHRTGYRSESYDALIEQVYAAGTLEEKAELLHRAETELLGDMPVIPIIFNQNATLISPDLKGVTVSYYGYHGFAKVTQKSYLDYIETTAPEETTKSPK
ncbi:MAG: hypothetical protein ILO42_05880 [Clostridia bacterium]|nr:hypothetical protein [Clostridia bacterium]MBP5270469.1 hypothetical protein [Clostridia bacterium]